MAEPYLDANKEPLVQGGVYVLGDIFYLLDEPIPSQPNQPIKAINDYGVREEIMASAFPKMFRLDRAQMRMSMNVLRTKANFLEKQLAQTSPSGMTVEDLVASNNAKLARYAYLAEHGFQEDRAQTSPSSTPAQNVQRGINLDGPVPIELPSIPCGTFHFLGKAI